MKITGFIHNEECTLALMKVRRRGKEKTFEFSARNGAELADKVNGVVRPMLVKMGFNLCPKWLCAVLLGLLLVCGYCHRQEMAQINTENQALQQQIELHENTISKQEKENKAIFFQVDSLLGVIPGLYEQINRLQRPDVSQLPPEELLAIIDRMTGEYEMSAIKLRPGMFAVIDFRRIPELATALLNQDVLSEEIKLLRDVIEVQDGVISRMQAINTNQGLMLAGKDSIISLTRRQNENLATENQQLRDQLKRSQLRAYVIGGVLVIIAAVL